MSDEKSNIIITAEDKTAAAFNSAKANANELIKKLIELEVAKEAAEFLGELAFKAIESGDRLAKMSDQLGVATQKLEALHYAGELAGVSTDEMDKNLTKMSRSLAEAAVGSGPAVDAFARLHLNANELAKLPLDQAFDKMSESMQNVHNAAERTAISMDIFGRSGARMSLLMADGSEALNEASKEAEGLGLSLNRIDAAKLEIANDSLFRMKSAVSGVGNSLALELTPYIKGASDWLVKLVTNSHGFKDAFKHAMDIAVDAVGFLIDAFHGLEVVWQILKTTWHETEFIIVGGLAEIDRAIVDTLNKLPKVHLQYSEVLQGSAQELALAIEDDNKKLQEMLMEPMPSEGLKKSVEDAKATVEKGAEHIAERSKALRQTEAIAVEQAQDDILTAYDQQYQALLVSTTSEIDIVQEKYDREADMLSDALANDFMTREEYERRKKVMTEKYEKDITAAKAKENAQRYGVNAYYDKLNMQSASFFLGGIANLMQSHKKKEFELGKKAAIAQTMINTYQAAMGAFNALANIPYVGPVLGAIAAAAAIAFGMSQVGQIRSQQFEGGGGGAASSPAMPTVDSSPNTGLPNGSPGGDVGSIPALQQQAASSSARNVNITLVGTVFTADMMRDQIIPLLNEQIGDGVNLTVTTTGN